jgi:hypothetical protein
LLQWQRQYIAGDWARVPTCITRENGIQNGVEIRQIRRAYLLVTHIVERKDFVSMVDLQIAPYVMISWNDAMVIVSLGLVAAGRLITKGGPTTTRSPFAI